MIFGNYWKLMWGHEKYTTVHTSSPWWVDVDLYDITGVKVEPTYTPYYSEGGFNPVTYMKRFDVRQSLLLGNGNSSYIGDELVITNDITSNFSIIQDVFTFSINKSGLHRIRNVELWNKSNSSQTITEIAFTKGVPHRDVSSYKTVLVAVKKLSTPVEVAPNDTIGFSFEWIEGCNSSENTVLQNYYRVQALLEFFGQCYSSRSVRTYDFGIINTQGSKITPYIYPTTNQTQQNNTLIKLYRSDMNYKIVVGGGNNTYIGDEYALANDITSNFSSMTYSLNLTKDTQGLYRQYTVTGTNNSGADQTITELGFVKSVPITASTYSDVLYLVSKLPEPLTVPAGSSFRAVLNWNDTTD